MPPPQLIKLLLKKRVALGFGGNGFQQHPSSYHMGIALVHQAHMEVI